MIKGIGNDIIEVTRIVKVIEKPGFIERYFTKDERNLFERRHFNPETIGANFCAKEAVSKVLGTGFSHMPLKDIEILRNGDGQPYIQLYNVAKERSDKMGIVSWHITISHTKALISVVVIGEGL